MAFNDITKATQDALTNAYRVPGIAVDSIRLRATLPAPSTPDGSTWYRVNDQFIRVVPFISVDPAGRPYGRQYLARFNSNGELGEPSLFNTSSTTGTSWTGTGRGGVTAFGQDLTGNAGAGPPFGYSRFKKVSQFVRSDEVMVDGSVDEDVLQVQLRLASISIVRNLSLAVLQSQLSAASDDAATELLGLYGWLALTGYDHQTATFLSPDTNNRGMLQGLADIAALCTPSDGDFGTGPDVFVMSSRARNRLIMQLHLAGTSPEYHSCPLTGRQELHFLGIPVLTGRVMEVSDFTEAWAFKLFGPSGIRILHVGGDSKSYGIRTENRITVTQTSAAGATSTEVQNASRGVEVFGVYSLVVPEIQSFARLKQIPVTAPAYP